MKLRDELAKVLHESRMKFCWGKNLPENRKWPDDPAELRRRLHHGNPWLDMAYVQADALLRNYDVTEKSNPKGS